MKILLVLITQSPGGIEKRFYNYSKYLLAKQGNQHTIIISRSLISNLGETTAKYKNRVIKYGLNWNKKNVVTRYIDYILLIPILLFLTFTHFDSVHFVTPSSLFFRRFIYAKRKVHSMTNSIRKSQEELLVSKTFKSIMANNYRVDCLDENIHNIALKYYPEKASNIFFSPCSFIDYEGTEPKSDEKENVICFAGRLEDFKGIQLLVEIIVQVVTHTNYSIKIFGKGKYYDIIKNVIRENKLQDRVSLNYTLNIKKELVKSKIFLSLQREENYASQSLIEAMACGNAIIATNVGLTKMIVKEDFGMLIQFSSKDLLNAIIEMILDESALKARGDKARNFVLSNHTIEQFDQYLNDVYKS